MTWRIHYDPTFKYGFSLTRKGVAYLRADGAVQRYGRLATAQRVADRVNMEDGTTDLLTGLLAVFRAENPQLSIWERYPNISDEEDAWTDSRACGYWSRRFTEFCRVRGVDAVALFADDAEEELAGEHCWTRVDGVNVDWTARQFHNLEYPENPRHRNLPCPLVWTGEQHPVVTFGRIEEQVHDYSY